MRVEIRSAPKPDESMDVCPVFFSANGTTSVATINVYDRSGTLHEHYMLRVSGQGKLSVVPVEETCGGVTPALDIPEKAE